MTTYCETTEPPVAAKKVTQGVLRGATILARNGKIERIGYGIEVPPEADRIDATGLRVYPGLIACESRGILGSEPAADNTDVFALNLTLGLASGLTTVVTGNEAAKLTYGTLDGISVKRDLFVTIRVRGGEAWRKLREDLEKVRKHLREKADAERRKAEGEEVEEVKPQGLNADYIKLLERQAVARFDADDQSELRRIADLATEYDFDAVVYGAREGWVTSSELGRAGVACVITARTTRSFNRDLNRPNGARIENAKMLHESGVPVAVVPGSSGISLSGLVGRDLLTLPVEAAYAIRGGMSRQAALESITITAARILGVGDRVGSLEEGKDADFIVTDGDVLHYKTLVHYAVVNGRLAYDKSEESLLSHIRPLQGESRFSPGELLKALEEIHPAEEEKTEEEQAEEKGEGESGEGDDDDGGEEDDS